jgi:hypothetical protein
MPRLEKIPERFQPRADILISDGLGAAFSTGPCDRMKVEQAVDELYLLSGYDVPREKIWTGSPHSAVKKFPLGDKRNLSVNSQIQSMVAARSTNQIANGVSESFWTTEVNHLWGTTHRTVETLFMPVELAMRELPGYLTTFQKGYQDAGSVYFHAFFEDVLGLDRSRVVECLRELLKVGWWWPFEHTVVFSERPIAIHFDDNKRLHHTTEPAVEYPDGWGIYAIRGMRVPDFVIKEPHKITAQHINREQNAEVRRVMIERMGWDRFLKEFNATKIHSDDFGTLYRCEMPHEGRQGRLLRRVLMPWGETRSTWGPDEEDVYLVKVINSTPEPDGHIKEYILRVPPTIRRAKEGVAWTFGLNEGDYVPIVES